MLLSLLPCVEMAGVVITGRALVAAVAVVVAVLLGGAAEAQQLSPNFYSRTCPNLATIVRSGMASAVRTEPRMGASILRLFFHDCFVNVIKQRNIIFN